MGVDATSPDGGARARQTGGLIALMLLGLGAGLGLLGATGASTAASLAPPSSSVVLGPAVLATGGSLGNDPSCAGSLACTYIPWAGSGADPQYAVPVDGTIVDWRIGSGSAGSKVALRVLRPVGAGRYQAVGTSATATTSGGAAPDEFTTSLPVKVGDVIGLDNSSDALIFKTGVTGALPEHFTPTLAAGATGTPAAPAGSAGSGYQLQVDAYVVPSATTTSTSTSTETGTTTTVATTTSPAPPAILAQLCRLVSRASLKAAGITAGCTAVPTHSSTLSAISTARWGIQVPILGADHFLELRVSKPVSPFYLSGFRDSSQLTVGAGGASRMRNGMFFVSSYDRAQKKGLVGRAAFIAGGFVCNVSLYDRSQSAPPARAAFQASLLAISGSLASAVG